MEIYYPCTSVSFTSVTYQTFTLRGSIIQYKQGIQLCYGGCYDTK